ncbi:MFS general substrate transporter [Linderina pennispora]|uniref:MFS general substrate transporter n=1 Tax=Linderina pennispora TaxID=61395 RepID=A0A1Y1W040_9FUNG|nr:MFS general substrate transporter [Linderina pennispora]ORX66872.1 MFS general substrate transporter [Linderina pennispora]
MYKKALSRLSKLPKIGLTKGFCITHPNLSASIVVVAAFMGMFLGSGVTNSYGVFEEEYEKLFSTENTGASRSISPAIAIGAVHVSSNYLFTTIAGALCERVGMGLTTLVGGIMLSAGLFAAGFCSEVWQLTLTQGILSGAGVGTVFIVVSTIPTSWFRKKQGFLIGLVHSGSGVGGLVLAPLTRWLINQYSLSNAVKILAVILGIGIALVSVGMSTKPGRAHRGRGRRPRSSRTARWHPIVTGCSNSSLRFSSLAAKKRHSVRSFGVRDVHSTKGVLRSKEFWFLNVAVMLAEAGFYVVLFFLPGVLDRHWPHERAGRPDHRCGEWRDDHRTDHDRIHRRCGGQRQHVLRHAHAGHDLVLLCVVPGQVVHDYDDICMRVWAVCGQPDADGATVLGDTVWPERTGKQCWVVGDWDGANHFGCPCRRQGPTSSGYGTVALFCGGVYLIATLSILALRIGVSRKVWLKI